MRSLQRKIDQQYISQNEILGRLSKTRVYLRALVVLLVFPFLLAGPARAMAQSDVAASLSVPIDPKINVELVWVAPGEFLQGSPGTESGREPDEIQHRVKITQGFYIGKYPITIEQFQSFANQTNYKTEAERGSSGGFGWNGQDLVQSPEFNWKNPGYPTSQNHPVTIVTFEDAQAFCKWLSSKSKSRVQLPSESQWELACRAGTQGRTYAGDTDEQIDEIAWTKANSTGAQAVGAKRPNALGIFDMSGNVSEWCLDVYGAYPAIAQSDPLATTPDSGDKLRNVLRGGSWNRDRRRARSAARFRADPKSRNADIGFRIVIMRSGDGSAVAELDAKGFDGNANAIAEPVAIAQTNQPQEPLNVAPQGPTTTPTSAEPTRNDSFLSKLGGMAVCFGIPLFLIVCIRYLLKSVSKSFSPHNSPSRSSDGMQTTGTSNNAPLARGGNSAFNQGVVSGALGEMMDSRCQAFPQGFWFDTTGIEAGSIVKIEYEIDGRVDQYQFEVESMNRQRVYLGAKPSKVTIREIINPVGDNWLRDTGSLVPNQPPLFDTFSSDQRIQNQASSDDSPGSGALFGDSRFPSAY
jgi:formylglycine-generating enzyme required for sulfatase activity